MASITQGRYPGLNLSKWQLLDHSGFEILVLFPELFYFSYISKIHLFHLKMIQ